MAHLFGLKKTAFVLWHPHNFNPEPPALVIGQFQAGNPPSLANRQVFPLTQQADLWSIDAAKCGLIDGQVYHYWFEVSDSSPTRDGSRISCTDPMAFTVDWRLLAPQLSRILFPNSELEVRTVPRLQVLRTHQAAWLPEFL